MNYSDYTIGYGGGFSGGRDRVSDSERVLCFRGVIFLKVFSCPPIVRRPWADFRETLPHDAVCSEIVYLL